MGSPGSPIYAIITCAFFEHKFYHKHPNAAVMDLGRYIDDVLAFLTYTTEEEKLKAEEIWKKFKKCYPSALYLKEEPTDTKFTFLESIIDVQTTDQDTTFIQMSHKNPDGFAAQTAVGISKKLTQHGTSFSTTLTKTNTILNELHRVKDNCNTTITYNDSITRTTHKYLAHEYPAKTIKSALRSFAIHDPTITSLPAYTNGVKL